MSESEKVWILLINRVARGPYNVAQINEMLNTKLVRVTDLAHRVTSPKTPPDWKFLWQFDEFDRRKDEKAPPPGAPPRQVLTQDQVREKVYSQVPQPLWGIKQADVTSTQSFPRPGFDEALYRLEKVTRRKGLAFLLGFIGVVILFVSWGRSFRSDPSTAFPDHLIVDDQAAAGRAKGSAVPEPPKPSVVAAIRSTASSLPTPAPVFNPPKDADNYQNRRETFRSRRDAGDELAEGDEENVQTPPAPPERLSPEDAAKKYPSPYNDGNPFKMPTY